MRVTTKNDEGPVAVLSIKTVAQAWPARKGTGTCTPRDNPDEQGAGVWIAQQGLNYPEFITNWLMTNNARGGNSLRSLHRTKPVE
jgi:hypothetical protein